VLLGVNHAIVLKERNPSVPGNFGDLLHARTPYEKRQPNSPPQHVVIVTNCTRQAVVNLCVVCSLQTVLSMYGMVYRRTQILVV